MGGNGLIIFTGVVYVSTWNHDSLQAATLLTELISVPTGDVFSSPCTLVARGHSGLGTAPGCDRREH